jgi:hypothetical protein
LPWRNWESVLRDEEELVDLVRVPRCGASAGDKMERSRERRVAASVERVKTSAVSSGRAVGGGVLDEEASESESSEEESVSEVSDEAELEVSSDSSEVPFEIPKPIVEELFRLELA